MKDMWQSMNRQKWPHMVENHQKDTKVDQKLWENDQKSKNMTKINTKWKRITKNDEKCSQKLQ